jgi:uncharacterized protein (DUF486 family)
VFPRGDDHLLSPKPLRARLPSRTRRVEALWSGKGAKAMSQLIARYPIAVTTILLIFSNLFMTIAWYGHLKHPKSPLVLAIVVSWGIAFLEYCFQVPANRISYGALTLTQLKILQEVITLIVFTVFALVVFGQALKWNYAVSYLFIVGAVYFAFKV